MTNKQRKQLINRIDELVNTRQLARNEELACDNATVQLAIGNDGLALKMLNEVNFAELCKAYL